MYHVYRIYIPNVHFTVIYYLQEMCLKIPKMIFELNVDTSITQRKIIHLLVPVSIKVELIA